MKGGGWSRRPKSPEDRGSPGRAQLSGRAEAPLEALIVRLLEAAAHLVGTAPAAAILSACAFIQACGCAMAYFLAGG